MFRSSHALSAALAALLVSAAAPVAAALFGDDVARKGVAEQRQRVDALHARYEDLAGRIAKLEDAVSAQTSAGNQSVQSVLELANQLQTLREELRGMRGQLEVLSNSIESNAKRQRDMYVDLDTRLRRFEQAPPTPAPGALPPPPPGAAPATPTPGTPAPGTPAAAAPGSATADETRAYEAAQNQRRIGNYQAAVVAFQNFVLQYPKSPLAHRAAYWIGDSHYNLRDYKSAIASQQKLIATYPDSASVPDALLNIASSYIELGDVGSARKTLDMLVARYPASEAAEKARRRLASLR